MRQFLKKERIIFILVISWYQTTRRMLYIIRRTNTPVPTSLYIRNREGLTLCIMYVRSHNAAILFII